MFPHAILSMSLAVALTVSLSAPTALAQANTSNTHHDHQTVADTDSTQAQDQNIPIQSPIAEPESQPLQEAYPPKYPVPALPYQKPESDWYQGYSSETGQFRHSHQILKMPEPNSLSKIPLSGYVSKSEKWNMPSSQSSIPQQQPLNANRPPEQQNQPQSNFLLQQQAPGCSDYQLQPGYASPASMPQQPTRYYGYSNQQYQYPDNSRRPIRTPKWNPLTIFRGGCF